MAGIGALFDLRVAGPGGASGQIMTSSNTGASYDVLPDGQRFVMVWRPDSPLREIVLVQNFFEELKRLVPN